MRLAQQGHIVHISVGRPVHLDSCSAPWRQFTVLSGAGYLQASKLNSKGPSGKRHMACNNMCTSSDSREVVLEGCRLTKMVLERQDQMAPGTLAASISFTSILVLHHS